MSHVISSSYNHFIIMRTHRWPYGPCFIIFHTLCFEPFRTHLWPTSGPRFLLFTCFQDAFTAVSLHPPILLSPSKDPYTIDSFCSLPPTSSYQSVDIVYHHQGSTRKLGFGILSFERNKTIPPCKLNVFDCIKQQEKIAVLIFIRRE